MELNVHACFYAVFRNSYVVVDVIIVFIVRETS